MPHSPRIPSTSEAIAMPLVLTSPGVAGSGGAAGSGRKSGLKFRHRSQRLPLGAAFRVDFGLRVGAAFGDPLAQHLTVDRTVFFAVSSKDAIHVAFLRQPATPAKLKKGLPL